MGVVYVGVQLQLERPVAIKFLRAPKDPNKAVKRFHREAFVGSQLCHPNIVTVLDCGETEHGDLFMVMEYLRGELLSRKLLREGALPPERVVNIGIQLVSALRAMHALGVVHRDVKPENIMIREDPEGGDLVKIFDLGLVHPCADAPSDIFMPFGKERLTLEGSISGTPGYVSPEQAAGEPPDARADIYGVGAVLFQMITGRRPFDGSSILEVLTKQVQAVHPTIKDLKPECPPPLEAIVRRCLRKRPENRFSSASELLQELEDLKTGRAQNSLASRLPIGRQMLLER